VASAFFVNDMRLRFSLGRRLLMITAMLAIVVVAAVISVAGFVLFESPLHCPPTMGCGEQKHDDGCSTWGGLLQPARDSEPCTSK
jgi:hypothetical protein